MKKYILPIILFIIILAIFIYYFAFYKQNNSTNYNATKIGTEIENSTTNSSVVNHQIISETQNIETTLSEFSTKIQIDDDNRDKNIMLTASFINGTVIKNGDTFSFNNTAGNPTPDRGYEKAGVFVNGQKVKGYGGGNCQVSTTIYNAALKVDGIEITERHEHGMPVGYVEMGKDATVAYDDLDLKFKNNTGYDIKIYVEVINHKLTVKIVKI
ncbi:MAG: VanW family protein [Clostridia bacterium]